MFCALLHALFVSVVHLFYFSCFFTKIASFFITTGNVDAVMDGAIDIFINAYLKWIALAKRPAEQQ